MVLRVGLQGIDGDGASGGACDPWDEAILAMAAVGSIAVTLLDREWPLVD